MIEPLYVVCVLKQGPHYSMEYVERLAYGLRCSTPEAQLICLTDSDEHRPSGVHFLWLEHRWAGWWSKMNLFKPGILPPGLKLYLDLDTVVTHSRRRRRARSPLRGDLQPLFDYPGNLAILRDFNLREHKQVPGKPAIGSAVLLWRGEAMWPVWNAFIRNPTKVILDHSKRMDHFIRKHLPPCDYIQDLWPGLVQCAKDGFKGWRQEAPGGAALLCTWGGPRIHELPPTHWYRRLWEG